jgi:hypothetical protein
MGTESWARSTAFSIWVYRVVMGPGVPGSYAIGNIFLLQFSGANDGVGGHQMGEKSRWCVMKFVVGRRRAQRTGVQGLQ